MLAVIAFVLALLLKTFLIQAFFIPSASMEPTLEVGDRVLVNKLSYTFREPRRGELVVFTQRDDAARQLGLGERIRDALASGLGQPRPHQRDFIKRIMGLPGDTVEVRDGAVYIDGERLPERTADEGGYLAAYPEEPFGPVEVPPGHYFMLGDNRPNSADSRSSLGMVRREAIVGRAFVVIWPVRQLDTLPISDYGED